MTDEADITQNRKIEHIKIILEKGTQYQKKTTLFECIRVFPKRGEIDANDVDTSATLLGKKLSAPIFISGMTGGHPVAFEINKDIALAASKLSLPMGVGSQRAMLQNKDMLYSYDVKKYAKDLLLIGNIGASKLSVYSNEVIQGMLDSIQADMLAIHTNPGQESVQPEGDVDFRGALSRIEEVAKSIRQPTVLKEVGNGISKEVARKLRGKVFAVDVQGAGGTTWIAVEIYRSKARYGNVFWEWGIPTAQSVIETKSAFDGQVWASGGIRSPADIVKAMAIGADLCGIAKPVIEAERKEGEIGAYNYLMGMIEGVKGEMARLGLNNIKELKKARVEISEPLRSIMEQRGVKLKGK